MGLLLMRKIKDEISPVPTHLGMKICVTGGKVASWNHVTSDLPRYDHTSEIFLIFEKYSPLLSTSNFFFFL
jgi:hypothetical protein